MPNPTTNPKPSPKPPGICKKGPPKAAGPPQLPSDRILTALVGALTAATGLQPAVAATLYLRPLITPFDWAGEAPAGGYAIDVAIFKNRDDDNYAIELAFYAGATQFLWKQWLDVKPKTADPLEFADLQYKDPLTGNQATLTITS